MSRKGRGIAFRMGCTYRYSIVSPPIMHGRTGTLLPLSENWMKHLIVATMALALTVPAFASTHKTTHHKAHAKHHVAKKTVHHKTTKAASPKAA